MTHRLVHLIFLFLFCFRRCQKFLFLQMTGRDIPGDLGPAEQEQALLGAFAQKNVLLVLDDCWDLNHAARLTFLDDTSSSKLLISSRVRKVLEGCVVVEIQLPNEETAVSMLMAAAAGQPSVPGVSAAASSVPQEARSIVRLCNLLPLAIGIAGAMVRELGLVRDDVFLEIRGHCWGLKFFSLKFG